MFVTFLFTNIYAQNRWEITENGTIRWTVENTGLPHFDHIEMSGQQISMVLRYGVDENLEFQLERSIVFPMLRTIPNDTHASLMFRNATDITSMISVNGRTLQEETVEYLELNGMLTVKSIFSTQRENTIRSWRDTEIEMTRTIFPSTENALLIERYEMKNPARSTKTNENPRNVSVMIPEFHQSYATDPAKGVDGSYIIESEIVGSGNFVLQEDETLTFWVIFSASRKSFNGIEKQRNPKFCVEELNRRTALVKNSFQENLVLETPDPVINNEFAFAKIRAAESIYKTKGGMMHGPGGESYYAAIWANDQAEYINPFFPFLGYDIGNESAFNAYMHFARFMNGDYEAIPSSIIAEGTDIWNGAGDRGDAAMIAYGAARYALARGDKAEAEQLWPLIEWCLEYCHRKLNADGVVTSDSDELEGRFPSGNANLCTSSLYYDALISATYLGKELKKDKRQLADYQIEAAMLKTAVEVYFGADLYGFHTYRYYDSCTLLRSWICIPLTVNILDRADGTIDAIFSDYLWHDDGLLTEQGDVTYWDRSTLYAMRGAYIAGATDRATKYLDYYSNRRLLGEHVPYPIEAFPEGSQRHLSAESGLYCRVITEGLFGIKPTGFKTFDLTPRLPEDWNEMSLKHIRAFGDDFGINVKRNGKKINIEIISGNGKIRKYSCKNGEMLKVKL